VVIPFQTIYAECSAMRDLQPLIQIKAGSADLRHNQPLAEEILDA